MHWGLLGSLKLTETTCFFLSQCFLRQYCASKTGCADFAVPALMGKKRSANKIIGAVRDRIQSKLDKGQSVNSIAREESLSEGSIRHQIKIGHLKKV